MSPFFSLNLLTLFIISFIAINPTHGQDLIDQTCKISAGNNPNINFDFCTTSLQAAPASHCATLRGLGMIAIRLVHDNVTDTHCYVERLMRNEIWDQHSIQRLRGCSELYSDAIYTVQQAIESYNAGRFDDANVQISSVMTAATTCEDGFNEIEGLASPLTKRNRDTFQLSAVVLSIMCLIQQEGRSDV